MYHVANTDYGTYPICLKSNNEYLRPEIKLKVQSNINKDIIICHGNSSHLLNDNVCLKELKQNKTTASLRIIPFNIFYKILQDYAFIWY